MVVPGKPGGEYQWAVQLLWTVQSEALMFLLRLIQPLAAVAVSCFPAPIKLIRSRQANTGGAADVPLMNLETLQTGFWNNAGEVSARPPPPATWKGKQPGHALSAAGQIHKWEHHRTSAGLLAPLTAPLAPSGHYWSSNSIKKAA